ncbi:UBC33 [Scenedesmus sp. PABB004]|nr:UBC33 [Scenedesmus sp. PABB004]
MAQKGCLTRLAKEYKSLMREPVPHIQAHPSPSNMLEWHFVLEGAPGTDFEGGYYHGRISFPPQYPFKPPSIAIMTPNGRFAVNTKLCLSITDYHPESWNPMWSVGTILTGLLSFLYDSAPTTGSITSSPAERRRLAAESLAFNARNATFRKLFPDLLAAHAARAAAAAAAAAQPGGGAEQQARERPAAAAAQPGGAAQQGLQPPPPQQQQGAAGAGAARAGGGGAGASGLLTAAMVVLVLAIAAVPLFSTDAGAGLRVLARLRGGG